MGERPKHRLTHGVFGGRLCCVSQIKPFYNYIFAQYGIIERRTEANILSTSLEFGRFSKIATKMKLCTRGRPWFFVILWEKSKKGIAFAYGWV